MQRTAHGETSASPGWRLRPGRNLTLDQPRIMGILNVTPDSFSDGGSYDVANDAVARAMTMVHEGAAVIDVGGESTRPGAQRIDASTQIQRVVPVIRELRSRSDVLITIDTTLSEVAQAALEAGADAINDVAAGQEDDGMFALAAERGCGVILMHRRARPEDDSFSDQYLVPPQYDDVVSDVREFLQSRISAAMETGIDPDRIMLDPGLGFGKTVAQNYALITRLNEFADLGRPILGAASRKSFLGAISGEDDPAKRDRESIAVACSMWARGVRLFRVHDVAGHARALSVAAAVDAEVPAQP